MKRIILGLVLCLSIAAVSTASTPCTSTQCATTTAVVATPATAVVTNPIAALSQILVPTYGAQFVPSGQQQTAGDEVLREILQELRAMRAEIAALKQPAVLPLALADAGKVMSKSCVKCHGKDAAEKDGGGFVMFDQAGGLLQLAEADKRRVANRVSRNSMPPAPAKLAAVDKKAILEAFQGK